MNLLVIIRQQEEIVLLKERVRVLEARMNKNSQNSHKPPSADAPGKVDRTQSSRQPSDRKTGGQNGHEGHQLAMSQHPDHITRHPVRKCRNCGHDLAGTPAVGEEVRQVYDLPEVKVAVTEHRSEIKSCPCCGGKTMAEFPHGVDQPVQYGPRIQALAVYLQQGHYVAYNRIKQFFMESFGHSLSEGSLYNFNRRLYRILAPVEALIRRGLRRSAVLHFDETGMGVNRCLHWLQNISNQRSTLYVLHRRRGRAAWDDIGMLPGYTGTAMHDDYPPYYHYAFAKHGSCHAHHLRELRFVAEVEKETWAKQMKWCLLDMKESTDYFRQEGKKKLPKQWRLSFVRRYQRIVRAGLAYHAERAEPVKISQKHRGRQAQSPGKNLLDRFRNYQEYMLAFLSDLRIPFDNNQAERDIRMAKLKQKVSGCFRSFIGGEYFCRIRSFISTVRKRKLPVLASLEMAFAGQPTI